MNVKIDLDSETLNRCVFIFCCYYLLVAIMGTFPKLQSTLMLILLVAATVLFYTSILNLKINTGKQRKMRHKILLYELVYSNKIEDYLRIMRWPLIYCSISFICFVALFFDGIFIEHLSWLFILWVAFCALGYGYTIIDNFKRYIRSKKDGVISPEDYVNRHLDEYKKYRDVYLRIYRATCNTWKYKLLQLFNMISAILVILTALYMIVITATNLYINWFTNLWISHNEPPYISLLLIGIWLVFVAIDDLISAARGYTLKISNP